MKHWISQTAQVRVSSFCSELGLDRWTEQNMRLIKSCRRNHDLRHKPPVIKDISPDFQIYTSDSNAH